MSDYYATLGVAKGSSQEEIKKAYRKLAMQYHPDRNAGDKAAEDKFKSISEAYAVLSDPQKKAQYDQFGSAGFHQRYSSEDIFRGADFSSIFRDMGFGGGIFDHIFQSAHGGSGYAQRGNPYAQAYAEPEPSTQILSVGFHEAYTGGERQLQTHDGRSLSVKIPQGVKQGTKLRLKGQGALHPHTGQRSDLLLEIDIGSHPQFSRDGMDILTEVDLKISEALLGCSKDIPTMEGDKRIRIPKGVQHGTKIRVKGAGFKSKSEQGDLFAVIGIPIPKELDARQQEVTLQLAELGM
jgi:curved DNA-binding protein